VATDTAQALRARREAAVMEHLHGERHGANLDAAIAACRDGHATYDVVALEHLKPPGQAVTHPTPEAVREHLAQFVAGFPDLWLEIDRLHHADDAVIVEGRTQGTHTGEFNGIAPTGRRMDLRAAVVYRFEDDAMTNETVYFDMATMMRQLGLPSLPL